MILDPMYFIIVGPAMLLAMWAQWRVKSAYKKGLAMPARSGMSGAEVAKMILDSHDIHDVRVEAIPGSLSDHYDPKAKALRLSPDVFQGRSVASLGIAAHEAGHAIQDHVNYGPLVIRNNVVPLASVGSNLSMILFFVGSMLAALTPMPGIGQFIMMGAIALFSVVVFFQVVNLPVEFDASNRAKDLLKSANIVAAGDEARTMNKVLNAAAMTYVAATLTAILTLLYFILRSGLLNRN